MKFKSLRIFGIILLALFIMSMSECDKGKVEPPKSYSSGSYTPLAIYDDGVNIFDLANDTGSLTLKSDGSWQAKIVLTSPPAFIISHSGTGRDSQYLYLNRYGVNGLSVQWTKVFGIHLQRMRLGMFLRVRIISG